MAIGMVIWVMSRRFEQFSLFERIDDGYNVIIEGVRAFSDNICRMET